MKDCTTCKYGFVDEQFGFPMCHHPLRFSEDCVDFNKHQKQEEPEKATGIEEKKLPDGLDEAANDYCSAYYDWDDEGERKEVVRTFKAGAEWQNGQMMKEAVEVVVVDDWQYGKDTDGEKPAIKVRNPDWKIGEKKKVIILKEE